MARTDLPSPGGPPSADSGAAGLRRELRPFDFTLLVVGSIIGDGVFIVSGLGAQLLGPAQLLAWAAGGVFAALIGLAFIQCASIYPEVGGSYAYVRHAFGGQLATVAGWALYLGELAALPVFPLAFTRYLGYFVPVDGGTGELAADVTLVVAIVWVNILGVRRSGRLNDVLTLAKLVPLGTLILAGLALLAFHPQQATGHLSPFAPLGLGGFGTATVLIFWAYAGFELSVLPAGEVQNPRRTLPRGLLAGIAIAMMVYLLTALAVTMSLPSSVTAASPRPLADALGASVEVFGANGHWAAGFVSAGALLSIIGVCDVYMLSVARLGYALAQRGALPGAFSLLHHRRGTPWVGLVIQGAMAITAARFFDISGVLGTAIFFLGICYALTALAAVRLATLLPTRRLHVPGLRLLLLLAAACSVYLTAQADLRLILWGSVTLAAAVAGVNLAQVVRNVRGAPRSRGS